MHAIMTEIVLPLGLFLIMFGMGLSLAWADFARVLRVRRPFLAGTLSMLLLLPGLGFLLADAFDLPPELAVGLVLVATCPGGMFSNLMTDYGRGNIALSVTMTAVVSMIAIFTIPAWAGLALDGFMGADTAIGLPFVQILAPLVLFVLLPVALGMVIAAKAGNWAARFAPLVKNTAAAIVVVIMIYLAAVQESDTIDNLPTIIAAVVTLNLASVAIAMIVSIFSKLDTRDFIAVIMEHAVRQEGTGMYIAATLMGSSAMALPLLLNSAVGMSVALLVVLYYRRRLSTAKPA